MNYSGTSVDFLAPGGLAPPGNIRHLFNAITTYPEITKFPAPGGDDFLQSAAGVRLTKDQAAEFGHTHGSCLICMKELTDPESVARGIGPVCATRLEY
jgi:hypothetical protein